jgi:hypothetical protein
MRERSTATWVLAPRSFGEFSTWYVASGGSLASASVTSAGDLTKQLEVFPPHSTRLRQRSYQMTFEWASQRPYGGTAIVLDGSSPEEVSLWFFILWKTG